MQTKPAEDLNLQTLLRRAQSAGPLAQEPGELREVFTDIGVLVDLGAAHGSRSTVYAGELLCTRKG